jgi:hypothetical protein
MCARENCDMTSGRVMSGSMPRTFAIGSDNRLLLSEGLTAGEEVEKMWTGERQGLPLNSLEAQRLGKKFWKVLYILTLCSK